jgi:biotin-(acetyl-CoA carboxylase) ligase
VECDEKVIVGQAVDIDEDGALVLRTGIGTLEKFMAGGVTTT